MAIEFVTPSAYRVCNTWWISSLKNLVIFEFETVVRLSSLIPQAIEFETQIGYRV